MFDLPLDNELRPGEVVAGRYRVDRHLASGGFGDLWLAEQVTLGRTVALKVLKPDIALDDETIRRFEREARITCRVAHPNLVVFHDFGADAEGRLFLAMEYIAGRSLADVLDETPLLPLGRALHIAEQVCDALQAAHDVGVVHRDVKPGNVMLVERAGDPDFVKLIDFGILKEIERSGEARGRDDAAHAAAGARREDDLTDPDIILGTPEYLAPEIVRGERFDGRADQYAVGVLLYELVTGARPFAGGSALAILEAQVRQDAAPLAPHAGGRSVPPLLARVVARAMAKEPRDRYASLADLAAALRAVARPFAAGPQADPTRRPDEAAAPAGDDATVIDFLAVAAAPAPQPGIEAPGIHPTPRPLSPPKTPAAGGGGAPDGDAPAPHPRRWPLVAAALTMAALGGVLALLTG